MLSDYLKSQLDLLAQRIFRCNRKYFVIHYIGANSDTSAKLVKWYHLVQKGWGRAGYNSFLNFDGQIEEVEPVTVPVYGMFAGWGKNSEWTENSFQICCETVNKQLKLHPEQEEALIYLINAILKLNPNLLVGGHREFPDLSWYGRNKRQNTQCPGFSVSDWLVSKSIPRKNCFYFVWKG